MSVEWMLLKRELVRFLRQRNRVFAAIGQPLIFWLLFGAGFQSAFKYETSFGDMNYREYYFPGTIALIVLFTSIFSSFSIIEDRKEGFLQAVLVAPVRRSSIVLGKVLGSAVLSLIQALVFVPLGLIIGIPMTFESIALLAGVLFVVGFSLSALGFCFAWRMESTAGFHAVMSIILLPMWLLSGGFFPLEGAGNILGWIMKINPLTYGVSAIRRALYFAENESKFLETLPSMGVSLGVIVLFSILVLTISLYLVHLRPKSGEV